MFFVTGASGSGKTACLSGLRDALPGMDWHDFDEVGVPDPCPPDWRPRATERWLGTALDDQRSGRDTGVTGGAVYGEILACPSAPLVAGIRAALLDCHDWTRIDRLRRRGTHGATQDMLNWAAWQRMHAIDPRWRPDVIRRPNGFPAMRWERWVGWRRGDPRWTVEVIDTTHLTVAEVVARLVSWVEAERRGGA